MEKWGKKLKKGKNEKGWEKLKNDQLREIKLARNARLVKFFTACQFVNKLEKQTEHRNVGYKAQQTNISLMHF